MPVLLILESGLEKPTCLHPNLAPRAFEPKLQELLRVPWVLPSRLLTAVHPHRKHMPQEPGQGIPGPAVSEHLDRSTCVPGGVFTG